MTKATFIQSLFQESYSKAKESTSQISHQESIRSPIESVNCVHWVVGHIVVSRCNFLMLLDTPSIWDWPTCKLFIPGSIPTAETPTQISFSTLLADLDRTQNQLMSALESVPIAKLETVKDNQTVGEHLLEYAVHESFHVGQLELLKRMVGN
jgi:hypothetical protein